MTHRYIPLVPTEKWFKDGYFWKDPSRPWEIELYGYSTDNKFDLISNTCYKIVIDKDMSQWAIGALLYCRCLLIERERWPRRMNQPQDPKTRLEWRLNRLLYWLHLVGKPKKYGHQKRMSRDPFIAFYTACAMHDLWEWIEQVTIPWHLYRPNTWRWRRRLIRDKRKDYLQRIDLMRAFAVTYNLER